MKINYLILIIILLGCTKSLTKEEIKIKAENYCSCHNGVYFIKYGYAFYDYYVNCNDGSSMGFSFEDTINPMCK